MPNFVEKDLPPTRFQSCRTGFFNLQLDQLLLHRFGTFATFEHVRMDILAGRVGGERFGGDREVLAQPGVTVTMPALEAGIPDRSLRAGHKSIRFRKQAGFHLPHQ